MFAERLKCARTASGLSMAALASNVGISANAIKKYEHGETMPTSGNLLKLARALGVRSEYFFRPTKVSLDMVEYRKHASTPKTDLKRINGDVMEQAERWTELLDLYPDSIKPIPAFALPSGLPPRIRGYEVVEDVAEHVRDVWGLGRGPIPNMIDALESKGIMVIVTDVATRSTLDGLSGAIDRMPLVVVSAHAVGDRQRFTLAHELGHLLLHGRLTPGLDEEKACHRFAGAFLLPKLALKDSLGDKRHALEARELYLLKHEFGISMLAIWVRLQQCGVITESLQRRGFMHFSKSGWRKREPGEPYPAEQTVLLRQLVYRALGEDFVGESKAAELMGIPLDRFHSERKLEDTAGGTAHQ